MGRLSTHVLDTARGKPAAGVVIRLYSCNGEERRLLAGADMTSGIYELVFDVGSYNASQGDQLAPPPFLNEVVVRFGVSDAAGNYHVPLLLSPYGYTTYRGS
jgi:5-hydroxyisourate hydrolase